jgi:hypothetical protein
MEKWKMKNWKIENGKVEDGIWKMKNCKVKISEKRQIIFFFLKKELNIDVEYI